MRMCDIQRGSSKMLSIFVLLLYGEMCGWNGSAGGAGYGYDSGGDQGACGRPFRTGKVYQPLPPCDLSRFGYCTSAGPAYPWSAVKRFVRENHGLMKRMYGDQRHDDVLRSEFNDIEEAPPIPLPSAHYPPRFGKGRFHLDLDQDFDLDLELQLEDNELSPNEDVYHHGKTEGRYLKEDVLNTKFVYSEEPAITIRLKDISSVPYFRPTSQRTTTRTTTSRTTSHETTVDTTPTTTTTTGATKSFTEDSQERTTLSQETYTDTTTDTVMTTTTNLDSTTRTTTPTIDRIDDEGDTTNNNTNEEVKPLDNVLFQDMVDEEQPKPQYNYNMRGVNACPVKEEVVAPFWANNTRGEVLALLNMYPFEQYVHWEKCTHELRQMYCREGCRCEQQYRLHRLLAYDPDNECRGIFSDWFRFPSCCVCKCYGLPQEFRVTSRSPRRAKQERNEWPP